MNPTKIDHENVIEMKPPPRSDGIKSIWVVKAGHEATGQTAWWSCWKPTWREWWGFLFGRRVWLGVATTQHPVVSMIIAKDPGWGER